MTFVPSRAFIWNHCGARDVTNFRDIDELTAFADYRVPQSLERFGCLVYSSALLDKIKRLALIEQYSKEELEIRAGTIAACWQIVECTNEMLEKQEGCELRINSIVVDNFLWVYAKFKMVETADSLPYHLTRCCNY